MKYNTEAEINAVISNFKAGTIKREDWGHPEHLILAYHYLTNNDFDSALDKMKQGIFNLLKSFNLDLAKEMPYHETLTVFWMNTVNDSLKLEKQTSSVKIVNYLIEKFDKDYPLRFYSREVLFSDLAREKFVEADLLEQ